MLRKLLYQFFAFALTFCNYAVLHATRAAWSNATPQIEKYYSEFDSTLITYLNSTYLFCYAFVGIYSGHLADKYNKRWFIMIAYTLIGANVILLGSQQFFSKDNQQVWLYFLIRIVDGTLQSVGWATNLAILSNWFPKKGRGFLIGCWASNANVGDIIGAQIYKATSKHIEDWGIGIIICGALVITFGLINLLFLIEFPATKGIVIEENSHIFHEDSDQAEALAEQEQIQNQKSISFLKALLIPGVLIFSISFFFIKFSMYGIYYWLPSYLQDGLGYTKDDSANIFSLFSVGSICGNLLMGFLTDVLPYRSPVFIMGIIIATLVTLALTLWNSAAIGTISALLFFLGSSISGASIVIAAIECDLGKQEVLKNNQRALATVSGIIDGIAGFGSIVGQLLIGVFEKHLGWRPTFLMLTIATSFSAIPALFFMIKEYREWKSSKKARQYSQLEAQNQKDLIQSITTNTTQNL